MSAPAPVSEETGDQHAGELRRRQTVRIAVPNSAAIWVRVKAEISMP